MKINTIYEATIGKRLTKSLIEKNIDIDSFRKTKKVDKRVEILDLKEMYEMDSLIKQLETCKSNFGNCTFDMRGKNISIYSKKDIIETDSEVIERVIKEIKVVRKAVSSATNSLEILSKLGVSI
jgi:hypothetical protein